MGQGGSVSENKSFILSNWVQTKPNSNLFYNKVTNQQIERHEVLINDKNELSSYSARMHDQSLLICRLIYFHPKSMPKDDNSKKHHAKYSSNQAPSDSNRAKSTLKQTSQPSIQQRSSPKNTTFVQTEEMQPKVYCVYTDRMTPIKQWSKDKIIDVIEAFKKLTQVYGYFKVREHCICENQRKEVKIWINENPVSNFIVEYVESQQDMIADLAALLVSKKQKIAKELLDQQYFNDAIEHFSKLNDYDHKKYLNSGIPNSTSNQTRKAGFPASNRQSETSQPSFAPSEINNFYNVFVNTQSNYTVNSSLQNSKYNLINKASYVNPNFGQKSSNQATPACKDAQKNDNEKKQHEKHLNVPAQSKTQNEIKAKRQFSPTEQGFLGTNLTLGSSPSNYKTQKAQQKDSAKSINPPSFQTTFTQPTQSTITTKNTRNKGTQDLQKSQHYNNFGQKDLTENTSIMLNTKKQPNLLKNGSLDKQKDRQNANREQSFKQKYTVNSEKKPSQSNYSQNQDSCLHSTQNNKSGLIPKFIPSIHQQFNNRMKGNPINDTINRGNPSEDSNFIFDSFGGIQRELVYNNNNIDTTKTIELPKQFNSKQKAQKSGSSSKGSQITKNYAYIKPVSKIQQKNFEFTNSLGEQTSKRSGVGDSEAKTFIKTDFNQSSRSKSKFFIKSNNFQHLNEGTQSSQSGRNVVSQMNSLNPSNQNPTFSNTLSKKSFPKYFQQKQTAKSRQKHYEKSFQQRQKSRNLIGKVQQKLSPQKYIVGSYGGDAMKYQNLKMQEVVAEVSDSQAYSQEVIPVPNWKQTQHAVSKSHLRTPAEILEPRRKFPSTIEGKTKNLIDAKHFQNLDCKKSKPGTQIDSQQSYQNSKLSVPSHIISKPNQIKKPNSLGAQDSQNKSCIMSKSHFSHLNTNDSFLVANNNQFKNKILAGGLKNKKALENLSKESNYPEKMLRFQDIERQSSEDNNQVISHGNQSSSGPFSKISQQLSLKYGQPKSRDSLVEVDSEAGQTNGRNQSFPYPLQGAIRKNDKQFTFFNSNQKPSGFGKIEQIHPYEPSSNKGKTYFKKQSMKSMDEKQTLPRTTADERQKRLFKQTRLSEVLIDPTQLHKSDPGGKIQQLVEKIEKQKEALMKKNTQQIIDQKIDVKNYPIFKKWQPSMNVFGSLINHQSSNSSKKKDYPKSEQDGTADDKLSMQDDERSKVYPGMANSQNVESKKKIRKQVFMDYKGLFGDENPFQSEQSAEEKERAKKLQIKRQRQEQERLLQNASSKDLLIQQKVMKQKEKHAQLKSDLSKLFIEEV